MISKKSKFKFDLIHNIYNDMIIYKSECVAQ